MNCIQFPCIIPCIKEDYLRMHDKFIRIFECLDVAEIVFIGPESLQAYVQSDKDIKLFGNNAVSFLNENMLLEIEKLHPIYSSLLDKNTKPKPSSINWYYQQFLKMAYAKICSAEYYLCWDSDTIPLRKISMFDDNKKPYLDIKMEYNESYFKTIGKLFGAGKIIEKSFISEHMLFNKKYMLEIIEEIEKKEDIAGNDFCEKILNAVGYDNLRTGYSEFETYGTYIGLKHPSVYTLRNWNSFRNINFFIGVDDVTKDDILWLSKDYDAASFEQYQTTEPELTEIFKNPRYREKLSPRQFYTAVLESGIMGEYVNGAIEFEGMRAPV